MNIATKRGRGRPRKEETIARQALLDQYTTKTRTDEEIMADVSERFSVLNKLTEGAIEQNIRSFVVSGSSGVGKTYNIERILEESGADFTVIKGAISAVNLYRIAYEYRRPGNVIVLDDADSIFADEEGLNLLKSMCDTSHTRRVSWMKNSPQLKEDNIPGSFEFGGSFIFVTNLDFQRLTDEGRNKYTPHFAALMSRSFYLDLKLHDRHTLALWVKHVAITHGIFRMENITETLQHNIINFLDTNRDNLRELSIRSLVKLIGLAKTNPEYWPEMARITMCRT